jgi:catechol 2,3-dioxygenase-like lactoylglutathione lyase family enzyme
MTATITAICPQLPVADVAASVDWYCRTLGFSRRYEDSDTGLVQRDGCELHLWKCDDPKIAQSSSAYLRCADVDALCLSIQGTANGGRMRAPENRPWGMREFYLWDPDGNLLKFGQTAPEAPS